MPNASDAHAPRDTSQALEPGAAGAADVNPDADAQAALDGTLAAAIAGRGPHPLALPAPLPLVVDLVAQLATQLEALHAHGEAYGTLDPAHVLLREEPGKPPRAELAATQVPGECPDDGDGERDAFATSGFTAPERFEGERGTAGDQYALAALAYLLLTGEPPFVGTPTEQAFEQLFATPEPPRVLNPSLPFAVSAVILRALAKWPEDRYASVAAFAAALRYAAGVAPESAVPLPPWLRQSSAPERPFVVTRREPPATVPAATPATPATPAARTPPEAYAPRTEPPPPAAAHEAPGGWRAAAPPIIPPLPPEPAGPRYPILSPRTWRIQVAVASALLLALVLAAGVVMAASGGRPRSSAPPLAHAPATATPLPIATLPPAPTSTPIPTPTPTLVPTRTPVPSPTPIGSVESAASGDAATAGAIVAPASVAPRQSFTVNLTLVNIGHTAWSSAAGYALACDAVRHPTTSCSPAFSAGLGGTIVAPGGSITFTLTQIAPSGPGTYQAWFAMARHGQLFPATDASVRVTVS